MSGHETIEVYHETGRVKIDAGIWPLIEYFWERGWDTACSCQGDEGEQGYITFTTLHYAEAAMDAIHKALFILKDEAFTIALNTWWSENGLVGQILISPPDRHFDLVETLRKMH